MAEEAAQPSLTINTQYVKDHSFENPNAPAIYGTLRTEKPDLNVSVEVTPKQLQDQVYEVVLGLKASAKIGETTAFMVERSEEHTSELQSLMRISYAVFCLKTKKHNTSLTTKI